MKKSGKPVPNPGEPAPWSALRRSGAAAIEGYVDATSQWELVAEIAPTAHIGCRAAADFIVRAVTDHQLTRGLAFECAEALQLCLECGGLTWEAENAADIMVRRVRALTGA